MNNIKFGKVSTSKVPQQNSPVLRDFGHCLELHELGDVVEEGEDHNNGDVAPALAYATLEKKKYNA